MHIIASTSLNKKKILLISSDGFERLGFYHLLSKMNYQVIEGSYEGIHKSNNYDLIIFALSSEPLLGWAKYFMQIHDYCTSVNAVSVIIFVPNSLKDSRILKGRYRLYDGEMNIGAIKEVIEKELIDDNLEVKISNIKKHISLELLPKLTLFRNKEEGVFSKREYAARQRAVLDLGLDKYHTLRLIGTGMFCLKK